MHFFLRIQRRVVCRRDLSTAAQLLKSARAEFRAAGDVSGVSEVDAAMTKTKADIVVQAMGAAREVGSKGEDIGDIHRPQRLGTLMKKSIVFYEYL